MARDNRSLTVTALFQAFAIIRYRNSEQEYLARSWEVHLAVARRLCFSHMVGHSATGQFWRRSHERGPHGRIRRRVES